MRFRSITWVVRLEVYQRLKGFKVTNPQESVKMLIGNDQVEGSVVTSVIEIGLEQNHPAADGSMEGTHELHQNDDTQIMTRMMQENDSDPIPSLRGIDALKVKSIASEVNEIICNIRVKN